MQNAEVKKEVNLSVRTKHFALSIISLFKNLPRSQEAIIIGRQLLRSGTSVGAQYREAIRARSKAEFLSKLESALQELEETGYWLELLGESNICPQNILQPILTEQNELAAIFVSSTLTAKNH